MKIVLICLSFFLLTGQTFGNTHSDIKKHLGSVPGFMKQYPEAALSGTWEDMKAVELTESSIPLMYKELMGLAVSAAIPCSLCVHLHTGLARLHGAQQNQIDEALAMAGFIGRWSTVLSGNQVDIQSFKNDVNKMHEYLAKKKNMQAMEGKPSGDVYQDMKDSLGFVPVFFQSYPQNAVAGVWKEMKTLGLNEKTSLSPEYRHLIGLAVSSEVACDHCTYYHTQSALMLNAKKEQLQEAVAMAGVTKLWSTILSGHNYDNRKFRQEVDQIIRFKRSKKVDDSSVL